MSLSLSAKVMVTKVGETGHKLSRRDEGRSEMTAVGSCDGIALISSSIRLSAYLSCSSRHCARWWMIGQYISQTCND